MYLYEQMDCGLNTRYIVYDNDDEETFCSIMIYKDRKFIRIWGFLGDYFFIKQNEKVILESFQLIKDLITNFHLSDYYIPNDTYGNKIYHNWLNGDLYKTYNI